MTLGEKIRQTRKRCGLSQEQLADKLCVSRSAIAKWETGKGMPDVENLKILSRLLGVSVDSLLDDSEDIRFAAIREPYLLAAYGRGCNKVKKDRLMLEKFPGAKIRTLLGRPELTEAEKVMDSARGFLTPVPFGSPEYIRSVKDTDKDFYLVERDMECFFVTVTDDFLEVHPLPLAQTEQVFTLRGWIFIPGNYLTDA